ncbi:hypothetical protein [Vibrio harveyi]|uniref:hypothetical protein n=1 Tax=Vibrio harveyi TaxID=669 RepID=UPI003CF55ACC
MTFHTLDEAIEEIFLKSETDHERYRKIKKNIKFINSNFERDEIDKTFADLYLIYDQSESDMLRCFLLNKYQKYYKFDKAEELANKFQEDGILILKECKDINQGAIKVVHLNPKIKTQAKYPIQVSRWLLGDGAMSDALYKDPLAAIKQEFMISYLEVPDDQLEEIESILIEKEHEFRKMSNGLEETLSM